MSDQETVVRFVTDASLSMVSTICGEIISHTQTHKPTTAEKQIFAKLGVKDGRVAIMFNSHVHHRCAWIEPEIDNMLSQLCFSSHRDEEPLVRIECKRLKHAFGSTKQIARWIIDGELPRELRNES